MIKTIFISGKITGLPVEVYTQNFATAEYFLIKNGYDVVNPLTITKDIPPNDYAKLLAKCIEKLISCDAIFMLKGWQDSKGALIENYTAVTLGKEILFESDGYYNQ
jgi:hypothetical protein